jgi:hypothetical protein
MSRKENIAYYKIIHYKLLLFSLLVPGVLAAPTACAPEHTLHYVLAGTLMALIVVHTLSHLWWSRRVLLALKAVPKETGIRVMKSLHAEYK